MKYAALFAVALTALSFAACTKRTITTANGSVTVDKGNGTTTVTTKEGTVSVGQGAVDASKLNVPIYPSAQRSEAGSLAVSGANGSGQVVTFKTSDPFDKVYEWYKSQMPKSAEQMHSTTSGNSFASFQTGTSDNGTMVMISSTKPDETTIAITQSSKPGGTSATAAPEPSPAST